MTVNELLALLAVSTALRVFLPDLRSGMCRLLRAGARVGVLELLRSQQPHPGHRADEAYRQTPAREPEA
ncbi:hypothetical protein ABZ650_33080 [Streptomyces griseoviridis]|uniref:hypothetical protein n=1 Tax=Streptomyces griseoviridis TaxID=45398 RepID=UPI0033F73F71